MIQAVFLTSILTCEHHGTRLEAVDSRWALRNLSDVWMSVDPANPTGTAPTTSSGPPARVSRAWCLVQSLNY